MCHLSVDPILGHTYCPVSLFVGTSPQHCITIEHRNPLNEWNPHGSYGTILTGPTFCCLSQCLLLHLVLVIGNLHELDCDFYSYNAQYLLLTTFKLIELVPTILSKVDTAQSN